MKRKQFMTLLLSLTAGLSLVACTLPGVQIMDGDGMVYEEQTPDPVKPANDTNEGGEETQTDPDASENTVDNDAILEAFINNECEAKFDHIIWDEDDYYTLDEMTAARGTYFTDYYFANGYEDLEVTYDATIYYAYIDCGADGVKDLGIRIDYSVDTGYGDYDQFISDSFILMVLDGELKCVTLTEDYYRSRGEFNEYGFIFEGGSGGAALYIESYRFINSEGESVYDYYCANNMGYSAPSLHPYDLPEAIRDDAPEEVYGEDRYTTCAYNFNKAPEYPTDLKWDEKTGKYDAESQKKYDQYQKDYDEWLSNNFFTFESPDGEVEIPKEIKNFLDANNMKYYSVDEAWDVINEHQRSIGITDEIAAGGYPDWIFLSGEGQGTGYNEDVEGLYIGEYVDDLNDPNLQIARGSDGTYKVQIGIYRLCFLDDGVGELYDDRMEFHISDENGDPMEGYIVVDEDGKATVTFTYSEWDYIEAGTVYEYTKTSDEPNIFVPGY
ncbi:MAG: hypothetical protein J5515_00605 [Lachnospiraceae bacterium]|nr:hypothetical protein [Lachnospiraceae bacterium]